MAVALAAPHRDAVAAGTAAVHAGGNALDAALAAAVMLTVVYPHQCALGGDLIALVRSPDGQTTAVIAAGTAPAAIADVATAWTAVPRQGAHSVTVPGVVAGWQAIADLGARHGLGPAFRDAARTARAGSLVSEGLERAIESRSDAVLSDPGLAGVFAPVGRVLTAGERFVQPALADTMERLAADPSDFYRGVTADRLVATLRAAGGAHSASDFSGYRPEQIDPLAASVGGRRWWVAPPPSAGALVPGVVAAAVDDTGVADAALLVAASVRGVAARAAHLGDPAAADVDVAALLGLSDSERVAARRESRASGDTAAVVATDDEGWAVTIVQSVYFTFGSGLLDPATGVLLHNRASAFSMDAASPARLQPGARPPHTLCPLIIEGDGEGKGEGDDTILVLGCQGGRAQPWILSQLFADASSLGAPLEATLARPRWIVGDVDLGYDRLTLAFEPGVDTEVHSAAASIALPTAPLPSFADVAGHVQAVRRTRAGIQAASDPRADGVGIVCPSSAPDSAPDSEEIS